MRYNGSRAQENCFYRLLHSRCLRQEYRQQDHQDHYLLEFLASLAQPPQMPSAAEVFHHSYQTGVPLSLQAAGQQLKLQLQALARHHHYPTHWSTPGLQLAVVVAVGLRCSQWMLRHSHHRRCPKNRRGDSLAPSIGLHLWLEQLELEEAGEPS
jgi:hypothetical protein